MESINNDKIILSKDHLSLTTSNDVADISSVLKPYGIHFFGYSRHFDNGTFYAFVSNKELYLHHLQQGYPLDPGIPEEMMSYKFHYIPIPDPRNKYSQVIHDNQNYFNIGHCIYFVERFNGYTDICYYASTPDNFGIINFYLNGADILENFKFYFKEKLQDLLNKAKYSCVFTPQHLRPFIGMWNRPKNTFNQAFLKQISVNRYILDNQISITSKELQVLKLLAKGNTIKETSKIINISPRTVETYLNNLRNKLNLQGKQDIINVLHANYLL
jgi:DNA-binding CsgD family transcriptional regulator